MYVVAVGLGGSAAIDGASTDNDGAPIMVGLPLYGPCETERVTSGLTGGARPGEGGDAGMGKYAACGAGSAFTTAINTQNVGENILCEGFDSDSKSTVVRNCGQALTPSTGLGKLSKNGKRKKEKQEEKEKQKREHLWKKLSSVPRIPQPMIWEESLPHLDREGGSM